MIKHKDEAHLGATSMVQALEKAIKLPSAQKRIFEYVKDHQHVTATTVAKALNLKPNSVSSLLSGMVDRKMIKVVSEQGLNARGKRARLLFYSTALKEYVILPPTRKEVPLVGKSVQSIATEVTLIKPNESEAMTRLVDSLTIGSAKQLYAILHKMFKE